MKKVLLISPILFVFFSTHANVRLPRLVGDNMVLQRDIVMPIWGWADKGEKIKVTLKGKTYETKTGADGKWKVTIESLKPGDPFSIAIEGKNKIELKNIVAGDVWICSGQSNMEWNTDQSQNGKSEVAQANYPLIRLFIVPKNTETKQQDDLKEGEWSVCSPKSVKKFSAVGYFFGRDLHKASNVPVGLIMSAWGGTEIETWISKEGLKGEPTFEMEANNVVPVMDWNQKKDEYDRSYKAWQKSLSDGDKGLKDGKYLWAEPNTDYALWADVKVPVKFEYSGLQDLGQNANGPVWMQREFSLTPEQAKQNIIISLGKVEDEDQTFINGNKIGETKDEWMARSYTVSSQNLKVGKNIIVIRVTDYMWVGGLTAKEDELFIQAGEDIIGLSGIWKYKIGYATPQDKTPFAWFGPNDYPTLLYNGMIAPLISFPIKGAIWYQGENNAGRAYQYRDLLPRMIKDWRSKWNVGNFPFLIVQLANFNPIVNQPEESEWAELREAQDMALALPNTGMASAIDIGETWDIHPTNKQEVGRRLSMIALYKFYGKTDILPYGPRFKSFEVKDKSVLIVFDFVGKGLVVKDRFDYLKGFQIAGADKKFYWARAELINSNTVKIYSDKVASPSAVRYAWETNPIDANLYNSEGLPTFPFRTDQWKGITEGKK